MFTIAITTFLDRYENSLKPLITKLAVLFPNEDIIIAVNGHVKKDDQLKYLEDITQYCNQFKNVTLIKFIEPKGLSFIWNRIIEKSNTNKILLLNDDVNISPNFAKFIKTSGILNKDFCTINNSWSHYMISKDLHKRVGAFDEGGLLEIGGEDDDYSVRMIMNREDILNMNTQSIKPNLKLKKKKINR